MKRKERIKKIKKIKIFASEIIVIARIVIAFAIMFVKYCLEKCKNIFLPKTNRAQKMIILILYFAIATFFLAFSSFGKERKEQKLKAIKP